MLLSMILTEDEKQAFICVVFCVRIYVRAFFFSIGKKNKKVMADFPKTQKLWEGKRWEIFKKLRE